MGRKPPNSNTNPYASTIIPITGQPRRTTAIPPKKQQVPFSLSGWAKNLVVRSIPMQQMKPAIRTDYRLQAVLCQITRELLEEGKTPRTHPIQHQAFVDPRSPFSFSLVEVNQANI